MTEGWDESCKELYLAQHHNGDYVKVAYDKGEGWECWLVVDSKAGHVTQSPAYRRASDAWKEAERVSAEMSKSHSEDRVIPRRPNEGRSDWPKVETLGTPTQNAIMDVCREIEQLLLAKNEAYGDSALDPVRVFSESDEVEQIKVRIDDKLSRIKRGTRPHSEDTIDDLIGYLVLYKVAMRNT